MACEQKVKTRKQKPWIERYKELEEFYKSNKHSNVPHRYLENTALGLWVSRQRSVAGRAKLSAEQLEKLNRLDFVWEILNERHERIWEEKFERLIAYKEEHGDCVVPQLYSKDRELGTWIASQRTLYKRGTIRRDRQERLENIGFDWIVRTCIVWADSRDTRLIDRQWTEMYERLKAYHGLHGHSIVPSSFCNGKILPLGRWVRAQRTAYSQGWIQSDRKALLDELDFVWQVDVAKADQSRHQRKWDSTFDRLLNFKRTNGHVMVPQNYEKDQKLANWVMVQRLADQSNTIEPSRLYRLKRVGFHFPKSRETKEKEWEERFEELRRYQAKYGTTYVNEKHNSQLQLWSSYQRLLHTRNKLRLHRKVKLYAIGFDWTNITGGRKERSRSKNRSKRSQKGRKRPREVVLNESDNESGFASSAREADLESSPSEHIGRGAFLPSDRQYCTDDVKGLSETGWTCSAANSDSDESRSFHRRPAKRPCLYPVGTKLRKFFPGHGWFNGEIISNRRRYKVRYEDDDEEGFRLNDPTLEQFVKQARCEEDKESATDEEKEGKEERLSGVSSCTVKNQQSEPPRWYSVGTAVKKQFGTDWYRGTIQSYRWIYTVRYEDGEEHEFMAGDSLLDHIVAEASGGGGVLQVYPVGTRVKKHFAGYGWFEGKVQSNEDGLYEVLYDDGDNETFEWGQQELEQIVLPDKSSSTATVKLYPVGTAVKEYFRGAGWFEGEIVAHARVYEVRYDDGDEEEYDESDSSFAKIVEAGARS